MITRKIQVMIIEDSLLYQAFLRQVIESDDCLAVAGVSNGAQHALELIPELMPDIITLDLQLPDMDGIALLREICRRWNIPVIVVSEDADVCEGAIAAGARDFIAKIQDADPKASEQFRLLLKLKLKMQAEMRPVPSRGPSPDAATSRTTSPDATTSHKPSQDAAEKTAVPVRSEHIIAIGASLGGTETTLQILRRLPDDLPGIVIVQHMPPEYTTAYAMRLDRYCDISVREASNGDAVLPGCALVASGGLQMTVYRADRGYRVRVGGTQKYGGFCPSVDVLFKSVAQSAGSKAVGVILTGMGRDGAEGLKQMHDNKAYTLGQSKESCAVFGMPGVAWSLGGVDKLLPPDMIADEIIRYCSRFQERRG